MTNIAKILTNSIIERQSQRSGLMYVLLRMNWYWSLALLLLSQNMTNEATRAIKSSLEQDIIRLYKMLLKYQIRSVCSHHHTWLRNAGINMLKINDWGGVGGGEARIYTKRGKASY